MTNQSSRRTFLKQAGVLTALTIINPLRLLAAPVAAPKHPQNEVKSADDGLVFLFQGDSITDGNRGRTADPNHIMGHGYAFSIASRVGACHPEKHPIFINKGISGNKVSDLLARWKPDCLDLHPNVLSILVGVNDVDYAVQSGDASLLLNIESAYRSMLQQIRAQNPNVILVLCLPFILPVGRVKEKEGIYELHLAHVQEVLQKMSQEFGTMLVDFQQVMTTACEKAPADYWIWDGIHPTVAGHELLAREWIRVVSQRIPWVKK